MCAIRPDRQDRIFQSGDQSFGSLKEGLTNWPVFFCSHSVIENDTQSSRMKPSFQNKAVFQNEAVSQKEAVRSRLSGKKHRKTSPHKSTRGFRPRAGTILEADCCTNHRKFGTYLKVVSVQGDNYTLQPWTTVKVSSPVTNFLWEQSKSTVHSARVFATCVTLYRTGIYEKRETLHQGKDSASVGGRIRNATPEGSFLM